MVKQQQTNALEGVFPLLEIHEHLQVHNPMSHTNTLNSEYYWTTNSMTLSNQMIFCWMFLYINMGMAAVILPYLHLWRLQGYLRKTRDLFVQYFRKQGIVNCSLFRLDLYVNNIKILFSYSKCRYIFKLV